ncbi:hypothetical protein HWD99_04250 [Microbacterium sp. C5A9]|uniref:EF-Tu/IF-2/RF-3 family GTPase n=1 Tax=Microbacterium sp. C5A9 TaxID=2736663 RepID=UPI001F5238A7|nr:EF-Tu/IF-2/RF-3 family GTPase [Microbacterium sp. C5A9]MCI1017832.1 hypothetical protein [Microbacterium sp. C5A9]
MGWLFGRRARGAEDATETLRRYNEAEALRLAAMMNGASATPPEPSATLDTATGNGQFVVEDVFTITGRGIVATGTVRTGVVRVGDHVEVLRAGSPRATTAVAGIEMFRRTAHEATSGQMAGLVLTGKVDIARGDVIRPLPSA